MASYQNSAGNQGIGKEYYNWRYFNSNLQKLGSYSAPKLTDRPPAAVGEAVTNWADTAVTVFQGALGAFEARREIAYQEADDWLSRHSLEEYQQLMKEHKVPFQDDPLAMQRLKYRHGRIQSYLAEQDFQARIDRGEFVGKEPEEVDLAHYQALYDAQKENADIFPYQTSGDYFFNQGYWENANSNRDAVFDKSQKVSDAYMKQDALLNSQAEIQGIIRDPNVSAKAIYNKLQEFSDFNGYHFSPAERLGFFKGALELLGQTPYGHREIQKLADMNVPGMKVSFRDLFGDEAIRQLDVQSHNLDYMFDRQARLSDWTMAQEAIWKGDYPTLQKAWEEETALNGETDRAKFLFKQVDEARTQWYKNLKANAANSKGGIEEDLKKQWARVYISDIFNGNAVFNSKNKDFWTPRLAGLGVDISNPNIKLTESDINMVFEEMTKSGQLTPQQIAAGASRGNFNSIGTYNPYVSYVKSLSSSVGNELDATIKLMSTGGSLTTPSKPKGFDTLAAIYNANPRSIAPYMSDTKILEFTSLLANGYMGFPIEQQMSAIATYASNEEDKDFKTIKDKTRKIIEKGMDIVDLGEETSQLVDNPVNRDLFMRGALYNYMLKGGDLSQALEQTKDNFKQSYYNFSGTLVPQSYFSSTKYPSINPLYIAESVQKKVEETLASRGVKESSVRIYIDPTDDNKLKVVDWANHFYTYNVFTRDDIEKEAEDFVNNNVEYLSKFSSSLRNRARAESGESYGDTGVN